MAKRSLEIGGGERDTPRSLVEVIERTLALGAVVAVSFGAPSSELTVWLEESELQTALTGDEREFILSDRRTSEQQMNMSWQSERLTVLLWALGKIESLPEPAVPCNTSTLEALVPPYGDQTLEEFRQTVRIRSEDELFDAANALQDLHSIARQRMRNVDYRPKVAAVDVEIVQERHHAINWLVGYCGQSWDEITTDT